MTSTRCQVAESPVFSCGAKLSPYCVAAPLFLHGGGGLALHILGGGGLFRHFFGGGDDDEEDEGEGEPELGDGLVAALMMRLASLKPL